MTPDRLPRAPHIIHAFADDPHVEALEKLLTGNLPLPGGWLTLGASFPYPPAFVPILHDVSGTMYGMWQHPFTPRHPCFVGISRENPRATEIARNVQQLHTFIALLTNTVANDHEKLGQFLVTTDISIESIDLTNQQAGDDRDRLGAHPAFLTNCPLGLRTNQDVDDRFPSAYRPDTWTLACSYELETSDVRAPRWLREPGPRVFADQLESRHWPGTWLSLNSPGWTINKAVDAALTILATFDQNKTTYIADWITEVSSFHTGY